MWFLSHGVLTRPRGGCCLYSAKVSEDSFRAVMRRFPEQSLAHQTLEYLRLIKRRSDARPPPTPSSPPLYSMRRILRTPRRKKNGSGTSLNHLSLLRRATVSSSKGGRSSTMTSPSVQTSTWRMESSSECSAFLFFSLLLQLSTRICYRLCVMWSRKNERVA